MLRSPKVPILSRPHLNAFSEDFVCLEAHLSRALFEVSKKRRMVFLNCPEGTDKFDLGEKTRPTARPGHPQLVDLKIFV